MREIILHIGMHKTGTTSIQSSLKQFDDGSVRYAQLCDVNHSIPVYTLFSNDRHAYHIHRAHGRTVTWIDQMADNTRVSLDSELSMDRDRLIVSGEDIALIDPAGVDTMANYLRARADSVRVIAYVRDPIGFASSAMQQRIRGGTREPHIPTPEYSKRFAKFIDHFGESAVEFVHFNKSSLHGASVVQDFCQRAGIDASGISEQRTNESTSLATIQMLYLFNMTGLAARGTKNLSRAHKRFVLRLGEVFADGSSFRVPLDCARPCIDWGDVAWMEKVSGIKLIDDVEPSDTGLSSVKAIELFREILEDFDEDTLDRLRAEVAKIDTTLALQSDATSLLNVLFMSFYFQRRQATHKPPVTDKVRKSKTMVFRVLAKKRRRWLGLARG